VFAQVSGLRTQLPLVHAIFGTEGEAALGNLE
jgi:hypothetical protein